MQNLTKKKLRIRNLNRVMRCAIQRGRSLCAHCPNGSIAGRATMYVGLRCSMATWDAVSASEGIRVTAVEPLPTTTTFLSL